MRTGRGIVYGHPSSAVPRRCVVGHRVIRCM
jgi:hypothetical protein